MFLPLHYMGNSNYLKLVVPNMHKFSQFLMFCKPRGILDKINKEKYDLPMQIKSLYLALYANFGHQSMLQVLQGTLKNIKIYHKSAIFAVKLHVIRFPAGSPENWTWKWTWVYAPHDPDWPCRPPRWGSGLDRDSIEARPLSGSYSGPGCDMWERFK